MTHALVAAPAALPWNPQQVSALRRLLGNLSEEDLTILAAYARATGLDPLRRQIYAIPRGNKLSILVSIDGMRAIAEDSGEYEGQDPIEYCGPDGIWAALWLSEGPPMAARATVYRRGFPRPFIATARYGAYKVSENPLWVKMPEVMLGKCAEARALRLGFPQKLSGIYVQEEMYQAGVSTPAPELPALPGPLGAQIIQGKEGIRQTMCDQIRAAYSALSWVGRDSQIPEDLEDWLPSALVERGRLLKGALLAEMPALYGRLHETFNPDIQQWKLAQLLEEWASLTGALEELEAVRRDAQPEEAESSPVLNQTIT